MSDGIQYDEAWGQRLVQICSTPDVVKQRKIILSALNLQPHKRILDIGSGPGLLVEDNDVGCVRRHRFEPDTSQISPFRSGYTNKDCESVSY